MNKKKETAKKSKNKNNFFSKNSGLLFVLLLIASVLIIYARTSTFEFVNIDDGPLIYENPTVINPDIPYSQSFQRLLGGVHYKPLVFLSWKLEYNLWGPSASHFHTINWILHLLNTLLLFYVLNHLFLKLYDSEKKAMYSAFFVALLFTINPLRAESVAWATERKDVLFGFFFLISWMSYLKYLEKKNYLFLLLGALAYLLSGLSKSMGLPLLAILFLSDLWYNRKLKLNLITEKIPFIIVFIVLLNLYGLIDFSPERRVNVQAADSELAEVQMETVTSVAFLNALPPTVQWVLTASVRFVLWLLHSFIPVKLSVHYSHNGVYGFLGKSIWLFPLISLALLWLLWRFRKRNKSLLAGFLFFAVALSPALLLSVSGQGIFLSDRYTYMPSVGLFFAFVAFLNEMKLKQRANVILTVFIGFFFIQSMIAVGYWKNSEKLFTQAIKVYPGSGFAHLNLGKYYFEHDNAAEALKIYTSGIKVAPGYYKLYSNRGKLYFDQGKTDLALQDFDKCLSLMPDYVTALANRGAAYGIKQEYGKALTDFNRALEISPRDKNALSNRGLLYMFTRDYEKAVEDYSRYLEIEPDDADIENALGLSYHNLKRYDQALAAYNKAISLDNSKGAFYYNRSLVNNDLGNKEQALKDALYAQQMGANVNQNYLNRLQN